MAASGLGGLRYRRAVRVPRIVPNASRRTRLLLAALVWSGAGLGLLTAGARWVCSAGPQWVAGSLALAAAVGWAKGRFVLAPRAEANARRIAAGPESAAVSTVFPLASWGLVAVMMAAGALLRRSALPRLWLGVVYAAIGVALLAGSAPGWRRWRATAAPPRSMQPGRPAP